MLTIYDSNTTSFNNLGIGVLRDLKTDPNITEVLNGLYNLEFEYIKNGFLSEYIVKGNIVKSNGQLFRIWNIKDDTNTINVLAKHIFFDLEKNFLENVAPTNKTGHLALEWILDNTQTPNNYDVSGDCTKTESTRYVRMNPIEAIYNSDNSILKRYGGELELDNYNITLHNKRGNDLGIELRQGKNISGVNYNLDFSTVATRIMPVGRDGILLPEKYIDSPLINNYFTTFYFKYDVDVGVDEENGISLENCYDKMRDEVQLLFEKGIDKPTISLSIDFVELSKTEEYKQYENLETAHLGDSCKCYIPKLNLNTTIRIVKTIYNSNKKRITKVELGTVTPNYVSSKVDTDVVIKNALDNTNPDSILSQAKKDATNLIKHPFAGYLLISEETGEFYLMDTNSIVTAQKIWKFGIGGIGFSSSGINGTYETAITQDGQIVADFITTGKLSTDRIEGYNLLITRVNNLESNYDGSFSEIEQTINSVKTTIKISGGNNLIRNSALFYTTNDSYDFWTGNIKKITKDNSASKTAMSLQNGSCKQIVTIPNGIYTILFKYEKINPLANANVKYNGRNIVLENEGVITTTGEVTTQAMEIELNCDIDDGYIIWEMMLNHGDTPMVYSQNANELTTDTVKISKGIEVDSDQTNTKTTLNADGLRGYNKTTGDVIFKLTDTGTETENIKANSGLIGGLSITKVNNQTWITGV